MGRRRRVAIVEHEEDTRRVCRAVLEEAGWECLELDSIAAAERHASRGTLGAVALIDLDFDGVTTFDLVRYICSKGAHTVPVALTIHSGDDWLFPALAAGCVGYVLKSEAVRRLPEVLAQAHAGESPLTGTVARRLVARFNRDPNQVEANLSPREIAVMKLLAEGATYESVARQLGVTLATVRTYVQRIYGKLGVTTKAQATTEAHRRGLVT